MVVSQRVLIFFLNLVFLWLTIYKRVSGLEKSQEGRGKSHLKQSNILIQDRSFGKNIKLEEFESNKKCILKENIEYIILLEQSATISKDEWTNIMVPSAQKIIDLLLKQDSRVPFTVLTFGESTIFKITKKGSLELPKSILASNHVLLPYKQAKDSVIGDAFAFLKNLIDGNSNPQRLIFITDSYPGSGNQLTIALKTAKLMHEKHPNLVAYLVVVQERDVIPIFASSFTNCEYKDIKNNKCQVYYTSTAEKVNKTIESLIDNICHMDAGQGPKSKAKSEAEREVTTSVLPIVLGASGAVVFLLAMIHLVYTLKLCSPNLESESNHKLSPT